MVNDRSYAWEVLSKHVQAESLLRHCLAVEIAMRSYADKFNQPVEYWGAVGLLHDVDFELFADDHPHHAREILTPYGYSSQFITDIESHERDWQPERSLLQATLLALDELTGFILACAMVRPDHSLQNLEVKSVMKKMKDKAFARAVNRDTIITGAAAMGVDFKEHIAFVTSALATATEQQYDGLDLL